MINIYTIHIFNTKFRLQFRLSSLDLEVFGRFPVLRFSILFSTFKKNAKTLFAFLHEFYRSFLKYILFNNKIFKTFHPNSPIKILNKISKSTKNPKEKFCL